MSIIQAIIGTNLTIGGGGPPPYINVSNYTYAMNEGATNSATIYYENYPSTTIYWRIVDGSTASSDWSGGVTPSGSFNINGTSNTTFDWTTAADVSTEGEQYYYLQVGTVPFGFDILNQYLTINDTSTAPMFTYDDFTIEWWDKTLSGDAYPRPWAIGQWPNHSIAISYEGGSDLYWTNTNIIGSISRSRINQGWKHNAFVRQNGVVKGYINGVQYFTSNNGNLPITNITEPLYVGTGGTNGDYTGYIKDLHIVKGYAKYTSNFTPPATPLSATTGSVFLLPVANDLTKYEDTVGLKSGSVTGTVTYSEEDPWTYPGAQFNAVGYGGTLITPNTFPPNLRIGLKVSNQNGFVSYITETNYYGNIRVVDSVPVLPNELFDVTEETNSFSININYAGQGGGTSVIEVDLNANPEKRAFLAVGPGWTYQDPNGGSGTINGSVYAGGAPGRWELVVPQDILGTWTFYPPTGRGGSLYFNGASNINYGASVDWAMDVDNLPNNLTLNIDANNTLSYSGSGSTWTDLAGYGNITLVNSPTYNVGPPAYFDFNGSNQYATGSATDILPAANYTKMVWFKIDTLAADNNIVSSDAGGHYMFFSGGSKLYAGHSNVQPYQGPGAFGSTTTFNIDTWYFVAVTFGTTFGIKMYVNGVLDASDPAFLTPHNGNGSVNIGCFGPNGNLLNGKIGRVLCFSRELIAQEITDVFNATRNRYGI